jgi:hypothetical protein
VKIITFALCVLVCPFPALARSFVVEENRGQARSSFQFVGRGDRSVIGFSRNEVAFAGKSGGILRLDLVGRATDARWEPLDALSSTSSYFIGNNPDSWLRDIPHSGRLRWRGVYPGIDIVFHGDGDRVEYDFEVASGADPNRIRMRWRGAQTLSLNAEGDLEVRGRAQTLVSRKPRIFQRRGGGQVEIAGHFLLSANNSEVSFEIAQHDKDLPLLIDPTIDALSMVGGAGNDRIIAMSGNGLAGVTDSAGLGALSAKNTGSDIAVFSGQSVTIYGGSGDDELTSITRTGNGTVLAGWTSSPDFPVSGSPIFQRVFGGGNTDGFIILNPGSQYGFSTYLGGSGDDRILAVAADPSVAATGLGVGLGGFYVAGDTTSPDFPVHLALQSGLAGGRDGFLTRFAPSGTISESTYWGGSGDDTILALDATVSTCWFAGRTNSPDLRVAAALQSQLAGLTDAFLVRLSIAATPWQLDFATYYGGKGDDEITALKIGPDSWVWTGGNTTSAGLPLVNPSQGVLAGDMDSWIARFDPAQFAPSFVTFFGGAHHDELTSLTHDLNGDLYVAGFTNSTDLPVLNAFQSQPGGGGGAIGRLEPRGGNPRPLRPPPTERDDGFIVRFDKNGQPQMATYAGGIGDDRFRAVTVLSDGSIAAGGESDSPSIPALTPKGSGPVVNHGELDGMLLQFHEDGIYAAPLTVGDNLTTTLPVTLVGANTAGLPITVLSTNPSLLSVNGGAFSTWTTFSLSGHASAGLVDVIVSAPGLSPRHVPITLQPSYLVNTYTSPIPVAVNTTVYPGFSFATTDAATGALIYQTVTFGAGAAGISFYSSDTNIVQSLAGNNSTGHPIGVSLLGLTAGNASVTIVSSIFPVLGPQQLSVQVGAPIPILQPPDIVVGQMLETLLPLALSPSSPSGTGSFSVTLTSEDPSKVLLSTAAGVRGTGSITLHYSPVFGAVPSIWVHGFASSGLVRIRADVAGASPVYSNVALSPSIIGIATPGEAVNPTFSGVHHNPNVTSVTLNTWSTRAVFALVAQIEGIPPAGFANADQLPAPESTAVLSVASSDNSIVATGIIAISFNYAQGTPYVLFGVSLLRPGTATLSLSAAPYNTAPPLQITVLPGNLPFSKADLTLGKNLQLAVYFAQGVYDFPPGVQATITSSDPSRILVSGAQGVPEAQSTTVAINSPQWFYVSALSDAGDVPVTIQAPGYPPQTFTVHLAPTTFRLSPSTGTAAIGGYVPVGVFWSYPGPPTGSADIRLRPSLQYTFTLAVSDATVVRNDTPVVTFSNYYGNNSLTALKAGTATLTLTSTSAAIVDPRYATATVTVIPDTFGGIGPTLIIGKDLQRPLAYPQGTTGLRSLDPTRLLLTKDPGLPGVASLDNVTGTVYAQALSDSGEVTVSASAPNYNDGSLTVKLLPTAFGFFDPNVGVPVIQGTLGTPLSLRIAPAPIDPASGNPIVLGDTSLRPGLPPFNVNLLSSDPSVGSLLSPIAFIGGLGENTTQFRPAANGITEVSVVAPAGYADGGKPLHRFIQIAPPALSLIDITLGKDMEYLHQLGVPNTNTQLSSFTVTSSDPSRLLISGSSTTVGAASAAIVTGRLFYVQALAESGDVTVTVTATGFTPVSANVHLEPSYFSFDEVGPPASGNTTTAASGAPFSASIFFIYPSYVYPLNVALRPGVGPVTVPVTSSNPAVLSQTGSATFQAGVFQASAQFSINGAGTATLQIGAPAGFSTPPGVFGTEAVTVH